MVDGVGVGDDEGNGPVVDAVFEEGDVGPSLFREFFVFGHEAFFGHDGGGCWVGEVGEVGGLRREVDSDCGGWKVDSCWLLLGAWATCG